MASGRITGSKQGAYGVIIEWESTPDVANNRSTLVMRTYITYQVINISGRTNTTYIDGVSQSYSTPSLDTSSGSPRLVNTRTETIQHNDDGTRSVSLSANFKFGLNSQSVGWVGTLSASGTAQLDNIGRASTFSSVSSSVTAGSVLRVIMNRASTSFYHRATITFGSRSAVVASFPTSFSYAIPVSWIDQITDASGGTAYVSVQTYSDSSMQTPIGDPVTRSFRITVPSGAEPVISDGWATVQPYNTDSAASGINAYVQGYSRAQVTFDSSKVSFYSGATAEQIYIECNGTRVFSAPYLTPVLTSEGTNTIRCVVVDSRGMSSSVTLTVNVLAYAPPTLSDVSLYRSNSSGMASDTGTWIYAKATANVSSLSGYNSYTLTAWYRYSGGSGETSTSLQSGVGQAIGAGSILSTRSYDAGIRLSDALGNSVSFSTYIPTSSAMFNGMEGGVGAAFGKYAEQAGLLDSAWDIHSDGNISADETVSGYSGAFTELSADELNAESGTFADLSSDSVQAGLLSLGGSITAQKTTTGGWQWLSGSSVVANIESGRTGFGTTAPAASSTSKHRFSGQVEFLSGAVGMEDYSTGETATGMRWIDGSRIYRRVYQFANPGGLYQVNISAICTIYTLDKIIRIWGKAYDGTEAYYPIPCAATEGTDRMIGVSTGRLEPTYTQPAVNIRVGSALNISTGFIVVEYIK